MSTNLIPTTYPDPIPGVLPMCGISLLAGAPGTGKTAILATMLKAFRDGTPIFGHQPSPVSSIGLLCVDRSWSTNRLWFDRAGYPDIDVYSVADDHSFAKSRLRKKFDRIKLFTEFVTRLPLSPGGLIVPDPMALFLGGNLIDYDACMVACLELREVLHERQLTMIGTAHTAKLKGDKKDRYLRPQDQILGSTAIFGFTDTQMYLASPAELQQDYYTFLWCPHMSPPETFDLVRDDQGLFIPHVPGFGGNGARLLQLLPADGTPVAYSDLVKRASAIPISEATVKRLLETLRADGQVHKARLGRYQRAQAS